MAATTTTIDPVTVTASSTPTQTQFTAHVASETGELINEGTVTFRLTDADGNPVGGTVLATVVNGVASASFTVPGNTPAGDYQIKASYSDPVNGSSGGRFASSDGIGDMAVNATAAGTTLTAGNAAATESASPRTVGLVVLVNNPSSTVNVGTVTVTLLQNGNPVSQASASVSSGSATVQLTLPAGLSAGSYQLQQSYHDDSGQFSDSSGFGTLSVSSATPTDPPVTPAGSTPSLFQAVFTLYVNAIQLMLHLHGHGPQLGLPSQSELLDSINFHLPHAGPFGLPALISGVNAAQQALGGAAT